MSMPVIPILRRLGQECCEFEASIGYKTKKMRGRRRWGERKREERGQKEEGGGRRGKEEEGERLENRGYRRKRNCYRKMYSQAEVRTGRERKPERGGGFDALTPQRLKHLPHCLACSQCSVYAC